MPTSPRDTIGFLLTGAILPVIGGAILHGWRWPVFALGVGMIAFAVTGPKRR